MRYLMHPFMRPFLLRVTHRIPHLPPSVNALRATLSQRAAGHQTVTTELLTDHANKLPSGLGGAVDSTQLGAFRSTSSKYSPMQNKSAQPGIRCIPTQCISTNSIRLSPLNPSRHNLQSNLAQLNPAPNPIQANTVQSGPC